MTIIIIIIINIASIYCDFKVIVALAVVASLKLQPYPTAPQSRLIQTRLLKFCFFPDRTKDWYNNVPESAWSS